MWPCNGSNLCLGAPEPQPSGDTSLWQNGPEHLHHQAGIPGLLRGRAAQVVFALVSKTKSFS